MNIKLAFLTLFLSLSVHAVEAEPIQNCEINTTAKVYHFGQGSLENPSLFISSNCPLVVNNNFQKILMNSNGPISSEHLSNLLNEDVPSNLVVKVHPERIRVANLVDLLRERTQIPNNHFFRKLQLLDRGALLLSENEQLVIQCQNCRTLGEVNVELIVNQVSQARLTTRWLKAELATRTPALVAKVPQRVSHESLKNDQFEMQIIETTRPEDFFFDQEKLSFYRLNRPVGVGEAIKHTDLAGVNLVNVGTPATVFINNANLSLSRIANPIRGGKYGEVIQLRNPQTNKTILGKVIDFNKVEVEL